MPKAKQTDPPQPRQRISVEYDSVTGLSVSLSPSMLDFLALAVSQIAASRTTEREAKEFLEIFQRIQRVAREGIARIEEDLNTVQGTKGKAQA